MLHMIKYNCLVSKVPNRSVPLCIEGSKINLSQTRHYTIHIIHIRDQKLKTVIYKLYKVVRTQYTFTGFVNCEKFGKIFLRYQHKLIRQ